MTSTHTHWCPTCGRQFEHDDRSMVKCLPADYRWRCNACVLNSIYGTTKSEAKPSEKNS